MYITISILYRMLNIVENRALNVRVYVLCM